MGDLKEDFTGGWLEEKVWLDCGPIIYYGDETRTDNNPFDTYAFKENENG